ncbi:MAG: 1-deoxy-D-xylulose-5-phosphate synthase [Gammaproteobacteria bacterium]
MAKTYTEIPRTRPATPLLDGIDVPADLRELPQTLLPRLVDELREFLLWSVGLSGGHFGAGLGVVELTVALHYLYDTPHDRIVWDVGHQTYPHKILTGRRERMPTIRHKDGLAGFPKRDESVYDTFGVGHSSTSISAALGMALGSELAQEPRRAVAVIGDGAMTAGMAFEAMHHAAATHANLLVILNDNQMSISHSVGGLANYFARIWASKSYIAMREGGKKVLAKMPAAWDFVRRTEEGMKGMVSPDTLFEALGFNYIGPIDGHDIDELLRALGNMRDLKGPQLLHVYTTKGKGFAPAEADPIGYHALTKLEPLNKPPREPAAAPAKAKKFQDVFGDWLCDVALQDERLVGITPAMCEGSGMVEFRERFPARYHDVAIAEQHALTFAAGLACEGRKPVVAIYSTFLQRAYDQLVHDIALQNLDVTLALDRAGLVGEDGPTHSGAFDIAYLRTVPNLVIATPSDENECRQLLQACYLHEGPAAVRYPRGTGRGMQVSPTLSTVPVGKGLVVRRGSSGIALLNFGPLLADVLQAAAELDATVADMRFVKPLDGTLLQVLAETHRMLVTIEDHALMGGAGSAVNEYLAAEGIVLPALNLGIPDRFIEHATRSEMLAECGLDTPGIIAAVRRRNHR